MNESEEMLGVALNPVDDATGMMGMPLHDGKCGHTRVGGDSCHLARCKHLFKTRRLFH